MQNEIKTPCYVLDKDIVKDHMDRICYIRDDLAKDSVRLCYAMKANPLLIDLLPVGIEHIEVCSPGEFEICKAYGIPGNSIILSGVNKSYDDIVSGIKYGVDIITVESLKQFQMIKDYSKEHEVKVNLLPRLSSGAQFGIETAELEEMIKESKDNELIDLIGIHYFTGTQKKKTDSYISEITRVTALIDELIDKYDFSPVLFEYGAGLSAPYFVNEDHENIYSVFSELLGYIDSLKLNYKVGVELGRFFAFNSMTYYTTIDDIKHNGDRNICLVDGGIHHINYYGQNMAMRTPVTEHIEMVHNEKKPDGSAEDWEICGSLCTFADILARTLPLTKPVIGDILAFHNVGAYSIMESPSLFLSRQMPYIYSYSKDTGIRELRGELNTYPINACLS